MKIVLTTLSLIALFMGTPINATTLNFPDLSLSSTPVEIRTWAKQHQFVPVTPQSPYQESFQRENKKGMPIRHRLSFIADRQGLKMLAFEQFNTVNAPALIRSQLYKRFGKPVADQILPDKTLRMTYTLPHSEAARRIFLINRRNLTMLLVTDTFFAQLKHGVDESERAQQEAEQRAETQKRNAWLIPLLWGAGIVLGCFVTLRIMPQKFRKPIVRIVGRILDPVFTIVFDTFEQLFPFILGIVVFVLMILSGLAIGAGAMEWGTSWWWGLLWFAGMAQLYKFDEEGSPKMVFLAILLFLVGMFGVFFESGRLGV